MPALWTGTDERHLTREQLAELFDYELTPDVELIDGVEENARRWEDMSDQQRFEYALRVWDHSARTDRFWEKYTQDRVLRGPDLGGES